MRALREHWVYAIVIAAMWTLIIFTAWGVTH